MYGIYIYIPPFTGKINQMKVNIPYMDPMGYIAVTTIIYQVVAIIFCDLSAHTVIVVRQGFFSFYLVISLLRQIVEL